MRILFSYCFIFVFVIKINAQANLVPNPSFEIYSSCPTTFSQTNLATPWYDPTAGSSDYFNACATGYANVPFVLNGNSYQFARTGGAFTGLYALNCSCDIGREYIQVQLTSPLVHDSCYLIEFYCNLADHYYAVNKLGAYLSDTAIHYTGPGSISVLHYTPQIVSTVFLTDTINWMPIAGYYHANGGEKFLTIGDFKPFSAGDTLNTGGSSTYSAAYYFIDDVSITKVASCDTIGSAGIYEYHNSTLFNLSPNPSNGNMILKYSLKSNDKAEMKIYDVTGRLINSYKLTEGDNNTLKISEDELQNGIYFYMYVFKPI